MSNKQNFYEYNYTSLIADTRKKGLGWIGNVARMDKEGSLRKCRREVEEGEDLD
jgi:hypothetical protein